MTTVRRRLLLLGEALALSLAIWGGQYVRRGFWEPDEARFAFVTSEMQREGHWAVPHRHGEWYAHKPPLFFWLQLGAARLTGGQLTPLSARLPSFLGAVLTLYFTARFALAWADRRVARRAVLILATTALFWQEGSMGRMDALLCGLQVAGLYGVWSYDRTGSRWRALAGYACWGLAILAKGPVGLLVPLGAYVAMVWADEGGRAVARRRHLAWGVPLALLFPLVWLVAARVEGAPPEYFRELLFKQNVGRMTGAEDFGKPRPWYYYLYHFPLEFLPWTVFLPAAVRAVGGHGNRVYRRLAAWGLFVAIFFSLMRGKRSLYILLAYPAPALVLATAWDALAALPHRWTRLSGVVGGVVPLVLGVGAFAAPFVPEARFLRAPLVPVGIVGLAGGAWLIAAAVRRGIGTGWPERLAACMLAIEILAGIAVLPAMNAVKTPRACAPGIRAWVPPDQPLILYRINGEIHALTAGRPGVRVNEPRELLALMRRQRRGAIVTETDLWTETDVDARWIAERHPFSMGHKSLIWFAFRDPGQ